MRRAAALLAAVLALTACTSTAEGAGTEPSRTFPPGNQDVYLRLAGELLPSWPDARLTEEAAAVCDTLDDHPAPDGWVLAVKRLTDEGLPGGDAGALIAYATGTLCQEHKDAGPGGG